jgi:predicted DNA-binding transcriptional regulator AlpA
MTRKVLLASTAVIPDTGGGDGEPDSLIPDPQVCREFGVSAMTLWRWERDPDLNFPTRITVRRRNYRSRQEIEKFKARLLRGAIARRSREARG